MLVTRTSLLLAGRALLAAAASLVATEARANGGFPASGQVLRDPTNADIIWVSSSFGLAKSVDAGETFQLLCEPGIGYQGGFHPFFALTPTGAIFGGLPDGLASSRGDTCNFERAPALEGLFVADVSVSVDGRAITVGLPAGPSQARVYESLDDLATWQPVGVELPAKLTPLTLDAAPSDPTRLYVTAISDGATPVGVLVRSTDGGATWSSVIVPQSSNTAGPFLAAIDPVDPDRIYVRLNGVPGRLLHSTDAGETYEELFTTQGFFRAFDLAPAGDFALFGGDQDGLFRLDTQTLAVEAISPLAARCVNIDGREVFACATPSEDGFSAGVSHDGGATFEGLFYQECLEGMLACPTGTSIGDTCPDLWPMVAELVGADSCGSTGVGGGGGSTTQATAVGSSASSSGSGSNDDAEPAAGDGCSCRATRANVSGPGFALSFLLVAAATLRRRASR